MSDCQHFHFAASVAVGRVVVREGGPLKGVFTVDVKAACSACGMELEFQGLPVGIDSHGPTMSVDGLEARLVAVPKGKRLLASGRVAAIFRHAGGVA